MIIMTTMIYCPVVHVATAAKLGSIVEVYLRHLMRGEQIFWLSECSVVLCNHSGAEQVLQRGRVQDL